MKTNQDSALKNMSKYLLQGAEMLQDSCPNCKVPLLKLKDKIFCGGCNKQVVYANEDTVNDVQHDLTYAAESKAIFKTTETILLGKLENITNKLSNQQGAELLQLLEIIDRILKLLAELQKFTGDH